jgi:hypothetical protein
MVRTIDDATASSSELRSELLTDDFALVVEPSDTAEPEGFTPGDIEEAAHYGSLGPAYFKSRRVVGDLMARLEEDGFKPVVERIVRDIGDKLWDSVRDHLLYDAETNVQGHLRGMVDSTVFALLSGERWALERYPLAACHDGQAVRKAIVEHCGAALIEKVQRDEAADHRLTVTAYRRFRRCGRRDQLGYR